MLDVETNHQIILLYFKEGLSQRKIAQHLKISRKTAKGRLDGIVQSFKSKRCGYDSYRIERVCCFLIDHKTKVKRVIKYGMGSETGNHLCLLVICNGEMSEPIMEKLLIIMALV